MKQLQKTLAQFLIVVLISVGLAGCQRKQRPDETADDYTKYRRALHSAEVVYSLDALGDLFEIFKNGGVISAGSGKTAIDFTDRGLIAFDEIAKLLRDGLPTSNFDKARAVVGSFKAAVNSGAIKFNSEKAQAYYFNAVATVEVTINLLEAINAGNKEKAAKLNQERLAKASTVRQQVNEPWWNQAIVRSTLLATEVASLAAQETPDIWTATFARSGVAHDKNRNRLAGW